MKMNLYEKYLLFSQYVSDLKASDGELPDYEDICRRIDVEPSALDTLLQEELGMGGEELLRSFYSSRL